MPRNPNSPHTCPECGGYALHDGHTESGADFYVCTTCPAQYSIR